MESHKEMRKMLYSSVKLIANNSEIDNAFRSLHQNIMTRLK